MRFCFVIGTLSFILCPSAQAAGPEYNRDVRPILAENCFACHGPDSAARKAKLRLDRPDDAVKAGAIAPGKPDESEALRRIFSDDPQELMPPPKTKKTLTSAQKELLKQWVAAGAEYQKHWSLIAPVRPPLPAVKDRGWVRNPIDNFILEKLEAAGLKPAPEADRRTLARRLSLDLTGLPPEPDEVDAFVNDPAPDAYEKYVDRLMKSPHWGEHRGRHWLDYARYADTHGIHFDNYREIWAYRDWVIRAFNQNMRFDEFTIEQLAGDLLPNRTLDQVVASGFNRCNITTNEGGAIDEEYRVLYTRDRTETASAVWLGLTANCAVCHDHKFDPITQRDFYSMSAFFNNTTQNAMDGNVKDTPPVMTVPRPEDRDRWERVSKDLAEVGKRAEARKQAARADFDKWMASAKPETVGGLVPADGLRLHAKLSEGTGNKVRLTIDGQPREVAVSGSVAWDAGHVAAKSFRKQPGAALELSDFGDFEKDQAFSYGAWVKLPKQTFGAVFARMDNDHDYRGWDLWVQNGRVGTHIIHKWPDDALKVVSKSTVKNGQWAHVFVTYDGSGRGEGVRIYVNGVPQETEFEANALKSAIRTTVPFKIGQRHSAQAIDGLDVQDVRVYGRALPPAEVERLAKATRACWLAEKPAAERTAAETNELFDWWLVGMDADYRALADRLGDLRREQAAIRGRGTVAYVMQEKPAEPMAYVLSRGEYDKRRDPVKPDTPKALPPMPDDLPHNRLGFAKWLLRPEHPLTARVTINRFWQEVFGTGIVRTSGDFGVSGELPSHPELLDWLAVEFRESGWDVRKFFKLIVTSATYRQSAAVTEEKREKDPHNRLLSRGPRFRMDAEMVRDYALAASGLLVQKVGGPSVKPYQPDGVWEAVAMIGSNTRDYKRDSGNALYRRSVYTFWKRAAPPASMEIFNAPSRETCTVRRERTDTPHQALVTLNDPQFVEAARHLAQEAMRDGDHSVNCGIQFLAKRLLARNFRPEEAKVVRATLDDLLAFYKARPEDAKKLLAVGESKADPSLDPATLAAWTMTANQLMNLDEVLNK
jgi:mono/diheme cytochrome c family protein